jgi:micrococcal nuclease
MKRLFYALLGTALVVALVSVFRRQRGRTGAFDGQTWTGRVTEVLDGDTVWAEFGEGPLRLRFAHIDAPETGQNGGAEATAWLKGTLGSELEITVRPIELDYYGRIVAEIYHNGSWLNYWLVRVGLAWALPGDNESQVAEAQKTAQQEGIGLWRERYPTPPWVFRKAIEASPDATP